MKMEMKAKYEDEREDGGVDESGDGREGEEGCEDDADRGDER